MGSMVDSGTREWFPANFWTPLEVVREELEERRHLGAELQEGQKHFEAALYRHTHEEHAHLTRLRAEMHENERTHIAPTEGCMHELHSLRVQELQFQEESCAASAAEMQQATTDARQRDRLRLELSEVRAELANEAASHAKCRRE